MGILNHLFGGRKAIAKELKLDAEKRMKLWEEHLENYKKRVELAKNLWPKKIDDLMKNPAAVDNILKQIEDLVDKEFFELESEREKDDEILSDLKIFTSKPHFEMVFRLCREAVTAVKKQQAIITILRRMYDILQLELNTIKRLRSDKKPERMRDMLVYLSNIIIRNEGYLCQALMPGKSDNFEEISRIVKNIILGQKIEEKVISAEDKFVDDMVKIIGNEDSRHHLREAAVEIYRELLQEAGAPFSNEEDYEEGLERMNEIVNDDEWLSRLIKEECPKYSPEKVKQVMKAFRISFKAEHLEGAVDLYT